jgi:hypothetical protein
MMIGKCRRHRRLLASDEPDDHAIVERHAADCEACAMALEEQRALMEAAAAWRDEAPSPPPSLERRIMAMLSREALRPVPIHGAPEMAPPSVRWTDRLAWKGLAAAAALAVMGAFGLWRFGLLPATDSSELAQAIRAVDETQRDYARAIAELEKAATAVLAQASNPQVDDREAAILLAYRDRLAHLDTIIEEVQGFLDDNPGHGGGHTVLLAAYREKADVLREVIARPAGDNL